MEALVNAGQSAYDELEGLALDGLNSGEPIEVGPGYWEESAGAWMNALSREARKE